MRQLLLAHLSRRLIGELIVYTGTSVCRPSTFSNHISSEAVRPILSILHVKHLHIGGTKSYVFHSGRIRPLVAMATYSFHRLRARSHEQFFSAKFGSSEKKKPV